MSGELTRLTRSGKVPFSCQATQPGGRISYMPGLFSAYADRRQQLRVCKPLTATHYHQDRGHRIHVDSLSLNGVSALGLKPLPKGTWLPLELHLPSKTPLWFLAKVTRAEQDGRLYRLGACLAECAQAERQVLQSFCQSMQ